MAFAMKAALSALFTRAPSAGNSGVRFFLLLLGLFACVMVPFALWGDLLERAAPQWLAAHNAWLWIAVIGLALLISDVVLPIPSSVVAVALCWTLGPIVGASVVALGAFLSFVVGYGIGRCVPEDRLRRWIGSALWDSVRARARGSDSWWIALARPLPVLAELSAVLAGVWRLSIWRTFAQAAAASITLGILYGASAWLGATAPNIVASLAALLLLPALFWCVHRYLRRALHATQVPVKSDPWLKE